MAAYVNEFVVAPAPPAQGHLKSVEVSIPSLKVLWARQPTYMIPPASPIQTLLAGAEAAFTQAPEPRAPSLS